VAGRRSPSRSRIAKTGREVHLPLLKDVGWAVIDDVRAGRSASGCPQVFLRHTAPVGPFSDQDHLHQILARHARAAHVPVSEERRHGMHSLGHTLATRLMEDGTPAGQIADILGHQSAVDGRLPEVLPGPAVQVRPWIPTRPQG
jgi:integrase